MAISSSFSGVFLEGESGLVMAGLLSHTGDMNLFLAIFIAGLGGFAGDQLYFYIEFNKSYVHRKLKQQKRKLALAHLLLKNMAGPSFWLFSARKIRRSEQTMPLAGECREDKEGRNAAAGAALCSAKSRAETVLGGRADPLGRGAAQHHFLTHLRAAQGQVLGNVMLLCSSEPLQDHIETAERNAHAADAERRVVADRGQREVRT